MCGEGSKLGSGGYDWMDGVTGDEKVALSQALASADLTSRRGIREGDRTRRLRVFDGGEDRR